MGGRGASLKSGISFSHGHVRLGAVALQKTFYVSQFAIQIEPLVADVRPGELPGRLVRVANQHECEVVVLEKTKGRGSERLVIVAIDDQSGLLIGHDVRNRAAS